MEQPTQDRHNSKRQQTINKVFIIGFVLIIFAPILYVLISSKTTIDIDSSKKQQLGPPTIDIQKIDATTPNDTTSIDSTAQ